MRFTGRLNPRNNSHACTTSPIHLRASLSLAVLPVLRQGTHLRASLSLSVLFDMLEPRYFGRLRLFPYRPSPSKKETRDFTIHRSH